MTEWNPEVVRAEIARFWSAFIGKRGDEMAAFYASECSVFGSGGRRAEPGRLAAARRDREYFGPRSELRTSIGYIDVVMVGERAAVASYSLELHAERIASAGGTSEHFQYGRCTQVLALDEEGEIKIYHEHFSLPAE